MRSFVVYISSFLDKFLLMLAVMSFVAFLSTSALASGHEPTNPHSIESTIKALVDGNARFVSSKRTNPNQSFEVRKNLAEHGQTPMAAVLACSDSRVPVEDLFDLGFGDLFVIRAAGAVPGVDQVGSIEYAVAHLGVPVVLVLSHTGCGAVTAAVTGANEPGALGQLLKKLSPIAKAVEKMEGTRQLQTAVELSAIIFREELPLISPVLSEAVDHGKLLIISGVYDLPSGQVTLELPKNFGQSANGHSSTDPAAAHSADASKPEASPQATPTGTTPAAHSSPPAPDLNQGQGASQLQ
ncbi:MAG: carbonic anhydrase [Deltaproteobacteria bacterium]|jgi:carbonic anhydrase|nr:carbonic anhydrase [Deltaproteobacteria bacterium]